MTTFILDNITYTILSASPSPSVEITSVSVYAVILNIPINVTYNKIIYSS